jgi:hypothetical protein
MALTGPFTADAETADDRPGAVGNNELAMIARDIGDEIDEARTVECPYFYTRSPEISPEPPSGAYRTEPVVEYPNVDSVPRTPGQ